MYRKNCILRTLSREYYCLATNIGALESVHVFTGKLGQKCQGPTCADSNTVSKIKIKFKNHFLRILAVIGIFGPHLTIVMIFVTQNNGFKLRNGPGISDRH